jgi:hypothetical protein
MLSTQLWTCAAVGVPANVPGNLAPPVQLRSMAAKSKAPIKKEQWQITLLESCFAGEEQDHLQQQQAHRHRETANLTSQLPVLQPTPALAQTSMMT